jgi:hypothetical protein
VVFPFFLGQYAAFVWPPATFADPDAQLLCLFLVGTPQGNRRTLLLVFLAAGAGYYLERWGTTRLCWTYYTLETPPFFAAWRTAWPPWPSGGCAPCTFSAPGAGAPVAPGAPAS